MVPTGILASWISDASGVLGFGGQVMFALLVYGLPILLIFVSSRWLKSHLQHPSRELGREHDKGWDRERRRRYGRHQHKHGRHHRHATTSPQNTGL